MTKRSAKKERNTRETAIAAKVTVDGNGVSQVSTGIGLLDHLLELFAFHGLFDLTIKAKGDLKVDIHHTNEDVGIVLGQTFKDALGDKKGIRRFGSAAVPMESVTAFASVDISGRGYFHWEVNEVKRGKKAAAADGYSLQDAEHFFESFAKHLGMNLNIRIDAPSPDVHTTLEPVFKALGLALDQATQVDPRRKGVPSTKGVID